MLFGRCHGCAGPRSPPRPRPCPCPCPGPLAGLERVRREGGAGRGSLEAGPGSAAAIPDSLFVPKTPTRNRMSWIVVLDAPRRNADRSNGFWNEDNSSRTAGWDTVTFNTPRRTSPNCVCRHSGSPTAAFQASSSSWRARNRPYPRTVNNSPRISDSSLGPRRFGIDMLPQSNETMNSRPSHGVPRTYNGWMNYDVLFESLALLR